MDLGDRPVLGGHEVLREAGPGQIDVDPGGLRVGQLGPTHRVRVVRVPRAELQPFLDVEQVVLGLAVQEDAVAVPVPADLPVGDRETNPNVAVERSNAEVGGSQVRQRPLIPAGNREVDQDVLGNLRVAAPGGTSPDAIVIPVAQDVHVGGLAAGVHVVDLNVEGRAPGGRQTGVADGLQSGERDGGDGLRTPLALDRVRAGLEQAGVAVAEGLIAVVQAAGGRTIAAVAVGLDVHLASEVHPALAAVLNPGGRPFAHTGREHADHPFVRVRDHTFRGVAEVVAFGHGDRIVLRTARGDPQSCRQDQQDHGRRTPAEYLLQPAHICPLKKMTLPQIP